MWPSRPAGAAPAEFRPGRRRGRWGRGRGGPLARLGADGRRDLGGGTAGERRSGGLRIGRREIGYSAAEAQLRVGDALAAALGVGGRG
jgi:hypothetical protein